jgi:four helix bundle protein
VCTNVAEAWRRRRYKASFLAKLNDAEAESAETQVWLKFAVKCEYLDVETGRKLYGQYNQILGLIVTMINSADKWLLKKS